MDKKHGLTLQTARRIAGLSQAELARKAGVDHSLISHFESGRRDIAKAQYAHIVRIARALNIEPQDIWPVDPVVLDDVAEVAS